jgi:uncharacterized cupredoxin-like copper-binding protein
MEILLRYGHSIIAAIFPSTRGASTMKRLLQCIAAGLLMLAPAAAPSVAADEATTIKVALLDISSIMPMGTPGYGMMSPGWWQGQGTPNPSTPGPGMGMMGQGWWGQGYGMMGPGMMTGQGMMGGMMSVRLDKPTVKAGAITFDVTNWSRGVLHEVLVVSVDNPSAPLPYDYSQARVPEEQVKVLGEAADLQPNMSKTFQLTLGPGSYLLICNVPGHYATGMWVPLNVTP